MEASAKPPDFRSCGLISNQAFDKSLTGSSQEAIDDLSADFLQIRSMDAVFPVKSRVRPSCSGATPHFDPSIAPVTPQREELPCSASPRGSSTVISPGLYGAFFRRAGFPRSSSLGIPSSETCITRVLWQSDLYQTSTIQALDQPSY